ncbi:MAG: hypothetical protein ABSC06_21155 [Rhodopila sp.]|jgi:hypothetical protein
MTVEPGRKNKTAGLGALVAPAHCLAPPARSDWFTVEMAGASIVLAVCRVQVPSLKVLDVWRGLHGDLPRAAQR